MHQLNRLGNPGLQIELKEDDGTSARRNSEGIEFRRPLAGVQHAPGQCWTLKHSDDPPAPTVLDRESLEPEWYGRGAGQVQLVDQLDTAVNDDRTRGLAYPQV
jgi:hypothetical protein